ncbi:MAG: 2Fe-2S iron-sulfur cluster binding domain-containing protein, partial [Oscillospiraceae bacterium]|nr:2Fe-2S iron-sulfur cluster binding domain-containing protein [Oscillospiraceae bacterium]
MIFEFDKSKKSLLELIRAENPGSIDAPCGGKGRCGKCRVRVWGRLISLENAEIIEAEGEEISACCFAPYGPCRAETLYEPENDSMTHMLCSGPMGLAIDLGSTTLELRIYEMNSGRELARHREMNAQRSYGADVLSRIQAMRSPDKWEVHACLARQIAGMVERLCTKIGKNTSEVERVVF